MKNRFLLSLCLGCIAAVLQAQHTGRVFEDKNNNGIFDKGDRALRSVAVSDGLNVVQTGDDGTFTLPGHDKERFVFITTPSGYRTDNKHYRRIEGKNGNYQFGLQPLAGRVAKDGSHKFVHIADTEIFNTQNHEDWVNNVRDYSKNEKAAFIIHTGDICYENGLKSHINLMNTANMDCPMFYCIGNHDLVKGKYGEELFESIYGPVFYSFDMGNVHYIVTPMLGGDHAPSYKMSDVYRWMKNDLALVSKDKAVMVFNHDLLTSDDTFIYGKNEQEPVNLNEHNLKAWIYGHWHINYMRKQGDVYSVSTATLDKGGIDHSTSAFRVMHVDGKGDFTSELRYTYIDKNIQIASLGDGQMPVLQSGVLPLSVNVYSSVSPVEKVMYACLVNDKPVKKGQKLQQQTDWNWQGGLPLKGLKQGDAVTVRVTAQFGNGEKAETECSFTYQVEKQPEVQFADDWENLLDNPQHVGTSKAEAALPLRLAWTKNVGANLYMSSPLIYKGNVYVASVDEDLQGKGAIYALDGQNGSLLWKYPVRNSIKNTIAIDGGCVYAQDAQGYLYAVDAATGKLVWEKKLSVNGLPALIEGLVASGGVVYAGAGKGLCASDGATGKALWTNTGWGQGEGTTSTWSLNDGILVSGAQWSALYANDATTGKLLWKASENGLRNRGASPAFHGNLLYLISDASMFILDATTGKVIVRKPMPFSVDVTSTPLLTDKEIIFGSAKDGLVALDSETLVMKWNFKTANALVYTSPYSRKSSSTIETSPVLVGNTVFVGASDGIIYGINKDTGKAEWQYATGAPVFGSVAASGNALVATDFAGNVYVFVSEK
ncbi:outer membrane protein assembly factor BamB family protein [Bacteroides sp.]